jgi:hypothetical protein
MTSNSSSVELAQPLLNESASRRIMVRREVTLTTNKLLKEGTELFVQILYIEPAFGVFWVFDDFVFSITCGLS